MSQIRIVAEWHFGEIKRISNLFCSNLKWRLIWVQLGKLTLFMVCSKTLEHVYVEVSKYLNIVRPELEQYFGWKCIYEVGTKT